MTTEITLAEGARCRNRFVRRLIKGADLKYFSRECRIRLTTPRKRQYPRTAQNLLATGLRNELPYRAIRHPCDALVTKQVKAAGVISPRMIDSTTSEQVVVFSNEGYCPICRQRSRFVAKQEWLRDFYLCEGCWSCPRQRALVEILETTAPRWRELTVHESSPSINFFAAQCPGYTHSFFFENVPLGSFKDSARCEDLECLTFADDTFDVFLTQDVLEHVVRPDRALREIVRVLKPGGVHIFTTPKHKHLLSSSPRVRWNDGGEIEYLIPPQYHGNPIGDGRSLVTWDYGADFDDLASEWAGYLVSDYVIRDRKRGIDGEYLDVFVIRKDELNRQPRNNPVS